MTSEISYCTSCGYLSPPEWESCHNCNSDLDDAVYTRRTLIKYYQRLNNGHGYYSFSGGLFYITGFIVLISSAVLPGSVLESGLSRIGAIAGVLITTVGLSAWIGFSPLTLPLTLGDSEEHKENKKSLSSIIKTQSNYEVSNPIIYFLKGLGTTIIAAIFLLVILIVLGILSFIPLLNVVAALVSLSLLVVILCMLYIPFYVRNIHNVSRADAAEALLTTNDDGQKRCIQVALSVLTMPLTDVKSSEHDILYEMLNPHQPQSYDLVKAEGFSVAAIALYQNVPKSDQRELIERMISLGKKFQTEAQYGDAITTFNIANKIEKQLKTKNLNSKIKNQRSRAKVKRLDYTDILGVKELEIRIEKRRKQVAANLAAAKLDNSAGELKDLIQSAERALDDRQYKTAIQRFHSVDKRLPSHPPADENQKSTYNELRPRLDSGLATANEQRLLNLLPESATKLEQDLVKNDLPTRLQIQVNAIYKNNTSLKQKLDIMGEKQFEKIEKSKKNIARYRDIRNRVKSATSPSEQYLNRLDNIVGASVQDPNDAIRSGEAFATILEQLDQLESKDTDPSITKLVSTIQTELQARNSFLDTSTLTKAQTLVKSLSAIDKYLQAFPSLSIDSIVDEMRERVQNGASIDTETLSSELNRVDQLVELEVETMATELEGFIDEWQRHPAVDSRSWRRAAKEARQSGDPDPILEPYRSMQDMKESIWSQDDLYDFSWQEFEHLIANLYNKKGYETTVTSGSQDLGVDVWAEDMSERVAIQVKQYAEGNTVGREPIQKLESTLARGDADRIILVTSSSFATTAERYAANSADVELVNWEKLVAFLTQYDIPSHV